MKRIFLFSSLAGIFLFLIVLLCQFPQCKPITDLSLYLGSAAIHVTILSLAMFFLWKGDLKSTLASVGFPGTLKGAILYTAACLMAIFAMLFVLGAIAIAAGVNDQQKITDKIAGLPLIVLLFAAIGAPITEELFFRGFLVTASERHLLSLPKPLPALAAIVLSSVVFGLVHLSYGSIVEVIGTFSVGLILGATFRLSKSVTPCILAHMAYNSLALIVMTMFS
ncbi:MAG: type II CAAX endopeptidase family protein [Candidatus Micrarchaeota archaeon]